MSVDDVNRVKRLYQDDKVSFGAYLRLPAPEAVELAAQAGMDFVRIDAYHVAFNPQTLENIARAAHAHRITPWVRCRNDPYEIMKMLDLGAHAISVPNIKTAAEAEAVVQAAHYPPRGDRESSRPVRYLGMSLGEYVEWAAREVIVSCQIEGADGLANYREIVNVEGLDVVQTGRNDLSLALGVPGDQFHPKVLEAEQRIVEAALAAGKQVSLAHPMTDEGIDRSLAWAAKGVRILTMGSDIDILLQGLRAGMRKLTAGKPV